MASRQQRCCGSPCQKHSLRRLSARLRRWSSLVSPCFANAIVRLAVCYKTFCIILISWLEKCALRPSSGPVSVSLALFFFIQCRFDSAVPEPKRPIFCHKSFSRFFKQFHAYISTPVRCYARCFSVFRQRSHCQYLHRHEHR